VEPLRIAFTKAGGKPAGRNTPRSICCVGAAVFEPNNAAAAPRKAMRRLEQTAQRRGFGKMACRICGLIVAACARSSIRDCIVANGWRSPAGKSICSQ